MTILAGVDLGKTRCRAELFRDGRCVARAEGIGARGLAEPGGVEAARASIGATLTKARQQAGIASSERLTAVGIGAAGAEYAVDASNALLASLEVDLGADGLALASDSVIAHVGAFGGSTGAMVAMGTGAVAVGVGARGFVRVDGIGYWLGDVGGGSWIGRAALRAALSALAGLGPETELVGVAQQRYGDLDRLPQTLSADGTVAATTAAFCPDVVTCAARGDDVAVRILEEAADELARSAVSAARAAGTDRVTAVGGLTAVDLILDAWRARLPAELSEIPAVGSALDGAVLLAARSDLPHESHVVRRSAGAEQVSISRPDPADAVDQLATEQVRPDLADLDTRSPHELVDLVLAAEARVPAVVAAARAEIVAAVELAEEALRAGGRLIYVGAGTPGRLAALDAAECPPTFGTSPEQVVAVLAGGGSAAAAAVEGAEDRADAGRGDLRALAVTGLDLVVGITASGRTPYVLAALAEARERGARTVGIVNNCGSPVSELADITIELLTGAEVLAGSTRMTAGTAQKVVLNTVSTSAMIRLGKSYGAWMVDVRASNEKLRRRALRLLREAAGVGDETARRALTDSDGETKTALVSILAGVDPATARARLAAAGGRVRAALAGGPPDGSGR